jgi:hypothetical protein
MNTVWCTASAAASQERPFGSPGVLSGYSDAPGGGFGAHEEKSRCGWDHTCLRFLRSKFQAIPKPGACETVLAMATRQVVLKP